MTEETKQKAETPYEKAREIVKRAKTAYAEHLSQFPRDDWSSRRLSLPGRTSRYIKTPEDL